jgi:hypothetical protein
VTHLQIEDDKRRDEFAREFLTGTEEPERTQ